MTDENANEEEPKLIIDEDWKTQVQREKEELKAKKGSGDQSDSSGEEAAQSASPDEHSESAESDNRPLPPASMTFLVTSLATQAMASLGLMPGEDGKPMPKNLNHAKHYIDLVGLLEEKTAGNLDEDESKFLSETLHQMRMLYVSESNSTASS